MEKIIAILPQWLRESNRWKHLGGIVGQALQLAVIIPIVK